MRGVVTNVVSREDQPSAASRIFVDDSLNCARVIPALFQEISGKIIEVDSSAIQSLASTAAARKIFGRDTLGVCAGHPDRVRVRMERSSGDKFLQRLTVFPDSSFELCRARIPSMTVSEGVTPQLMALFYQGPQVVCNQHLSSVAVLSDQAKRGVERPPDTKRLENLSTFQKSRSWEVIKRERNDGRAWENCEGLFAQIASSRPLILASSPCYKARKRAFRPEAIDLRVGHNAWSCRVYDFLSKDVASSNIPIVAPDGAKREYSPCATNHP